MGKYSLLSLIRDRNRAIKFLAVLAAVFLVSQNGAVFATTHFTDNTWGRSSLYFDVGYGCQGDCKEITAKVCNGAGSEDMEGTSTWKLYWKASGNPKFGSVIASGTINALEAGECQILTYDPNTNLNGPSGNYKFKAYQRPGHLGSICGLWSETCELDCPECGDGVKEGDEECDDGNTVDGDGCSSQCELEFCGDGIRNGDEECDDGNNQDGDGCTSQCQLEGSISGHKWEDLDGDGYWDGGEPTLDGWTIFLDENGNETLDPGEVSTITSGGGVYSFSNLVPGDYDVCEVLQPGWTRTLPGLACYYLTVLPGQDLTNYDFGNYQPSSDLEITKDVSATSAEVATIVSYTIVVSNTGETVLNITVTDDPPAGFLYVTGSAEVDGVPTEPTQMGGLLRWVLTGVSPGQDVTITYNMTIGGFVALGTNVNTATATSGEITKQDPAEVLIAAAEEEPEEEGEGEGEVLGAVLAATGTSPLNLLLALMALTIGIFLRKYSIRLRRQTS